MTGSESLATGPTWPPARIAAGAVFYHPPEAAFELANLLEVQFDHVFVVENQSVRYQPAAGGGIRLIRNRENLGLATAINQLCEAARQAGHDWLVLFDQDSRVPADFRAGLDECLPGLDQPPALLAANYETEILGRHFAGYPSSPRGRVTELTVALNSGSMVNLAIHKKIGGHDEAFFVDHVDHDYCLRLARNGFRVLGTVRPLFRHEVGNVASARKFGRVWQSSGHSIDRRREWAEGLVRLAKRHWRLKPGWVLVRLCVDLPRSMVAVILLESHKKAKLGAVLGGLWRGIFSSESVR